MKENTETGESKIKKGGNSKTKLNGINALYLLGHNPRRRFIYMGIVLLFLTFSFILFIVFN